jgi:hypothetical protein
MQTQQLQGHDIFRLLRPEQVDAISAAVLKQLIDADPIMGYAVQTLVSRTYFHRHVETTHKLQSALATT